MSRPWQQIEVTDHIEVPFAYMDQTPGGNNLGRAEFHVCLRFSRRRSEFWVHPMQQRIDTCWHLKGGAIDFSIRSYHGLDEPRVWRVFWCPEHKATTLDIYCPDFAKILRIDHNGLSFLRHGFGEAL